MNDAAKIQQLQLRIIELERLVHNLLKPKSIARVIGGAGSGSMIKWVVIPAGDIAARSGTTLSSATCNVVDNSFSTTGDSISVSNPWPHKLDEGMYYPVAKNNGTWMVIGAGVMDVQWNSPDLEQTYDDGTNLYNIDTAEVCT